MKTQIFSNSKSVTPRPFLFIAEHGKGFLPDAIQVFEEAEKIREHEFIKGEIIYNHIAGLFPNEKGELTIYQSGINGFQPTPWIGSDYEQGKVDFIFLDLVIPLTEIEKSLMLKFVYEKVGTPYDFIGIADEMAETTTGEWPGEKGENAEKREFCSEAIATIIHHVRVDHFKLCYKTTPEEFVEDEHIKLAV